jgi:hypothetical protein
MVVVVPTETKKFLRKVEVGQEKNAGYYPSLQKVPQ